MPVTIYPSHRLNTLQPQLRYYLDTRGPGKTRLRSATRPGFLDSSPEIRNLVYEYAVVLEEPIERPSTQRKRPWLGNPDSADRQARADISTCFNFMLSCKTIYYEARSMFWGCNVFELEVVPTGRTESKSDDENIGAGDTVTAWKFDIPVEAPDLRKLVRRVIMRPTEAWSWFQDSAAAYQSSVLLPSIVDLFVEFDWRTSEIAEYPLPHALGSIDIIPNALPGFLQRLRDSQEVLQSYTLYEHVESALQAMTGRFPDLRTIRVTGTTSLLRDTRDWEGHEFDAFGEDCSFVQSLSAEVSRLGKDFVLEKAHDVESCDYCDAYFDSEKWTDYEAAVLCSECTEIYSHCDYCGVDWDYEEWTEYEDGCCPECAAEREA
ncbi:hypothetical protein LTR97_001110 [Elasticomyces elasticus]|uniref:Uncharacterized protein n=1 Tax=Elasticomyces elasticus TaxID=574655 RepID=A0AAN7WB36_9PEZI|nr:hypothetical protein LTR97_001110 [Elasticomyces elasticus]